MEDNTAQDPTKQEGSVWDRLAAPKPGGVWDRLAEQQQDPEAQRQKFILQQAAGRDPGKAADILRLSKRFNVSESIAEHGLDKLKAGEKANDPILVNLPDENPKLSSLLTGTINTPATVQDHIPALKTLDEYYQRPAALLPMSDSAVQQQARKIAKLRAERDWKTGNRTFATSMQDAAAAEAGITGDSHTSQQQMEEEYYRDELARRRDIESIASGKGEMGISEILASSHPGQATSGEAIYGSLPFSRFGPKIATALDMADAKRADAAGTADELQKDMIAQADRVAAIQKLRGKTFLGGLAEKAMGLPAFATEFGAGFGLGRTVSGALGLSKAAAYFATPAVGAATAGAPEAAQSFIQNKGEGDSTPEAAAKAARDVYAGYLGAQLLGPLFSKASPEVQAALKESLLKVIPAESIKMPLMNAATELIRAVGPDMAEKLQGMDIWKALHGDKEALKSITQDLAIGAASGGFHAMTSHPSLEAFTREAQSYADAAEARAKLLHEGVAKDHPELARQLSDGLAKDGPNEHTYIPVKAFAEHFAEEAQAKFAELGGDPLKYESAKQSGQDLIVSTAAFDHVIGADPAALKFFSQEIRPEPGAINLREAQGLEKAYTSGVRIPARERVIADIMEKAKGDKMEAALETANLDNAPDKAIYDTLGLSDQQMANIGQALGKAREHAKEILNEKEQARLDRLKSGLYEKEKARTTEEVTKEVDSRAEQLALARLAKHQLPDGTPLPEDVPQIKLSREALEAEGYTVSSLPRSVTDAAYPAGNGIHPEDAASQLGFKSGHDLLMALAGTNRDLAIQQEVDSRMAGKFPLGLQPHELSDEAQKALHNKYAGKLQHLTLEAIEANKLKQMVGVATRKLPSIEEIRNAARAEVLGKPFGQLDPTLYLAAEQRANREALAAVFSTKWEDVFDRRLEALHAHERYAAAIEAAEGSGKTFAQWEKLPEAGYLNKPGTYDFGQQIKNFLRKIGLVGVDPRDLATMKPFAEWAKEKYDAGQTRLEPLDVPKFAEESFATTPKDMTYSDLLELKDTIDRLTELARDHDKLDTLAGKLSREAYIERVRENVAANFKVKPVEPRSTEDRTPMESAVHFGRKFDATLDSPESFFNRMDGGKIDGPMNQLFQGQVEARTYKRELQERFAKAIDKAVAEIPKEVRKHLQDRVQVEGVSRPLTRREIIALVLNGGNESNYSKMVRGESMLGKDDIGLNHDTIQKAAKLLTEAEKDYAQKILDATNLFKPEVEKMEIWAKGRPPKMVEAKQMIEAMGERKGGYYPMMYDPRGPGKAGELQISGEVGKLIDPSYKRATTNAGYRESRVEEFAAPVDLNFSRLGSHVDSMLTDIAFRPWLMDANKIVSSPEFRKTMKERFGSEFQDFAGEWIKRVVGADGHPSASSGSIAESMMRNSRHAVTVATLAAKPAVFLHHALGFGPAIAEVGPARFAKAYGEFLSHPRDSYNQMISESKEMAHYIETSDVDVRSSLKKLAGKNGQWAEMQRFGLKVIPFGNLLRAIPTYFAAKGKATAELSAKGYSGAELEKLAIQSAEKTVRTTSGSGNPGDVPAIMKSEGMKMLLMFYTPGRVLYSQMRNAGHDLARGDVGKALFKAFWLLPFSAAVHTLVSGRRPNEDKDETELGMYAHDALTYPFSALPMGHDIADNALKALSGEGNDFSIHNPLLGALEKTFKAAKKTHDWYNDEAEFEDMARELFKTSGYWMGAPTEQAELTGGYVADLMRDKESPNDMWEFAHDLLWRKPASRR